MNAAFLPFLARSFGNFRPPLQYGVLTVGGIFMRRLRTSAIVSRVWGWVWIGWVGILGLAAIAAGQSPEEKTAKYMESVRHQPELLLPFLQAMPKGGDLHVHLYGAIYAESMIDWASENALCVDRSTSKLIHAACDSCEPYRNKPSVRCAYQDHILYDQLVDAWSMRNWHAAKRNRGTTISLPRLISLVRRSRSMSATHWQKWRRGRRPIICNTWS
jgi:hypothetical protein